MSSCFSQGYPLVLALLRRYTYEFFPVISLPTRLKLYSWLTTRLYLLYYNHREAMCQACSGDAATCASDSRVRGRVKARAIASNGTQASQPRAACTL